MGKILAIDWDRHQLRYVLATTGRRTVKVLAASAVPMQMRQDEDDPEERPDPSGTLRAELGRKASRVPALVGVDRASIETMTMTLPPATDEELPELVANQAVRDLPNIAEGTPLDFLPQNEDPTEPREVLVATLDPGAMAQIKQACTEAGIKPTGLLMRPYASASLFLRSELAESGEPTLLVNLVGDEVDLTVVAQGKIVFTRTARIPQSDDQAETDQRVLAEIGRTLMVAMQHEMGDQTVQRICLCGSREDQPGLVDGAAEQFEQPVVEFNPFDAVEIARKAMPRESGAFTSLLGMLVDEAHDAKHAIDFLNPREVPKPPDRRRLIAAVAVFLLIGGWYVWDVQSAELKKLDETIATLTQKHDEVKQRATIAAARIQSATALRAWHQSEVNWLDEMRDVSVRFPTGQDMVILRMNLSAGRNGGANVTFSGLARDPRILIGMEDDMRQDGLHEISSKRLQERGSGEGLTWSFETSMSVAPRSAQSYLVYLQPQGETSSQVAQGNQGQAMPPVANTAAQSTAQQGGRP